MKPVTLTIGQAAALGLSRVIRQAEENGMVLVRRNGVDVGLLMPLTLRGIQNLRTMFQEAMSDPSKLKDNPDLAAALQSIMGEMLQAVERKVAEKNRAEDSALVGTNTSAVPMESKGRRRKSSAALPNSSSPRKR